MYCTVRKPLNTRSNSLPSTASFVFVAVLALKPGFVATGVHYRRSTSEIEC